MIKDSRGMYLCWSSFRIQQEDTTQFSKPSASWCDFGIECKNTPKNKSAHHPYSIVALKELISELTVFWDRTVANMKAKNILCWSEWQLKHDVKN